MAPAMGLFLAPATVARRKNTFAKFARKEPKEGLWPLNACPYGTSQKVSIPVSLIKNTNKI